MKPTRWTAVAFGVVTLVTFLGPLFFRVESEAHVWLGFLLLLMTWYALGPLLLVITTALAAISSVLYLRNTEASPARRRLIVWGWVLIFLIEAGVASLLVRVDHLASDAAVAVIIGVVLAVTGASVFFVVRNWSGSDQPPAPVKRSQIAITVVVLVVIFAVAAAMVCEWLLSAPELPLG